VKGTKNILFLFVIKNSPVMRRKQGPVGQIYSYLALRKAVGWIAILLPFVMMLGVWLIFGGRFTLYTISMYYYSGMRDVFVGALCAIGLFLFFYHGYDRWDDWLGNIAGFCVICIAWFPTSKMEPLDWKGTIHFIAAIVFFITLACFSLFLFTRKDKVPTPRKLQRNRIHITCGVLMAVCLASIMIYFQFFQENYPHTSFVFWAETVALEAFGVSWLTKGGVVLAD